ncbi:MAG: PepSY-like domain-containing protein [Sediminicola sp.]
MKIIVTSMLLMALSLKVQAQDLNRNEVPKQLLSAFESDHSNATDVEWEKEVDNYKVEFEENHLDVDIWYGTDGKVLKMEQEVREQDLPQAIRETISKTYAPHRFDEGELHRENGKDTYKVELEDGDQEKTVYFTANGNVVKETN